MKKMLIVILIVFSFAGSAYAAQGVIDDPDAGLQWVPAPNQEMTWDMADAYARNLYVAWGGWRLPTIAELKSLYNRIESLGGADAFGVKDRWSWSSEFYEPKMARDFNFRNGKEGYDYHNDSSWSQRALVVRSRR